MAGAPSDDLLELLRSQSGLAVDAEGRFLHRGEPITHARTLEVLWRSLTRRADGRWEAAIGRERGYVAVEETPWVVVGIVEEEAGAAPGLVLSDRSREALDPATLWLGPDGLLRCRVKGGEVARFGRSAQATLGLTAEEWPPGSGRFALTVGGVRHEIPQR